MLQQGPFRNTEQGGPRMKVAIYARVSTVDKDQNPDTQLLPLREYAAAQGWQVVGEFVDHASAANLRKRPAWAEVMQLASHRKVAVILVWKLDRAFRSVMHATGTIANLRRWGVGLRSLTESWLDTSNTSPASDLVFHVLTAVAEFERSLIGERVRAGLARARKQGKTLGRRAALNGDLDALIPALQAGQLSMRDVAKRLGVHVSTVSRTVAKRDLLRKPYRIGASPARIQYGV